MSLLPVAVYSLEVPCGGILVPAGADFPATFRITMAAIDPSATPETVEGQTLPRATLKIVRQPLSADESDDEDDEEYMRALMGGDSDSESESDDEEVNGGPSDPTKTKKAKKDAAVKQLLESIKADEEDSDEEMANGDDKKVNKGKAAATFEDDDEESDSDDEEIELEEFVLCTLDPEKNYQQTLDITVGEKEEVFFKVHGTHTIYLTGNYVIPNDDGHNHHHEVYDSDSDDDEDNEDYDLSPDEDELELELEDDESDALDGLENPRVTEIDSEDEIPKLVKADEKKGKNKRSADDLEEAASLDEIMSKAASATEEPKLSKKQLKKLKKNNGEAVAAKTETPTKSDKSDKKVQFAKNLEQGPTGSAEKPKVAGTPVPAKSATKESNVTIVNDVKIEDKKTGSGPAAKNGDKLSMRYIGKLQNGKVFDSNKSGTPFSFKLGKGEVIKGWEIGLSNMKVGGERRLTIPAKHAYGSKKNDGIPANSTLVFDVKLLSIS